jgi:hypothetical protein
VSWLGEKMAQVTSRHAEAFQNIHLYAWKLGLGLGLLDVMGELPHHDRWIEPQGA